MVDSAFESWWSIFLNLKKILVIRTHPEELRVFKCIGSTHISSNFSQQWGQRMLTKCYPTLQECSCDFARLKIGPLDASKPYRTCPIASDETNKLCDFRDFVENLWDQTQIQKVFISSEAMRHRMRMFDTVLERPKTLFLVWESPRNILVILGNTWSTSVYLIVIQNV